MSTKQEASCFFVLSLFLGMAASATSTTAGGTISLPGCPDKCGNVSIPYPFGIGESCAAVGLSPYFNFTCDDTARQPRPMVGDPGKQVRVMDVSLERGELRLCSGVSYICYTSATSSTNATGVFELDGTPFRPSPSRNRLTVIGCSTLGLIGGFRSTDDVYSTGCYSYCASLDSAACSGAGCCEVPISPDLGYIGATFATNWTSGSWRFNPCFYATIAEAVRDGWCPEEGDKARRQYACVSINSHCVNSSNGMGYWCNCSQGYEGNPYLVNGCRDIDECALRKKDPKYEGLYPCNHGICINTPGSYHCKCKTGTKPDGTSYGCQEILPMAAIVVVGKNSAGDSPSSSCQTCTYVHL